MNRLSALVVLVVASTLSAQLAPEVAHVYPPGGKAGSTVAVLFGGAEWTPDMEFFVHDKRVKLEITGPPSDLLIPPPPYWFGAKGRLGSLPLLREIPGKFVLPADLPPGPIRWQTANANGATSAGVFIVGTGNESIEEERSKSPQVLPGLPATVSGRLLKNEEVDRYRFSVAKAGPVTCELTARRLGSNFNGVIEVFDARGKSVATSVDTEGLDPVLTFAAAAGEYSLAVRDIDHAGDRSFTYRLTVTPGPRVLATVPTVGRRGETREVEFLVDAGAQIESIRRIVTFPAANSSTQYSVLSTQYFDFDLKTPWGSARHAFPLSDSPETVGSVGMQPFPVAVPGAVTGVLDEMNAEACYSLTGKKGDRWSIAAEARRHGSPLDLMLRILGPDGKEIARNDDLPGTTDAGLEFILPIDGAYQVIVGDTSGATGSRLAIYRLAIRTPADGFTLYTAAQKLGVPLGGKTPLIVKATRTGNFKGPITLTVAGLPVGVTIPTPLVIPADKAELALSLEAAANAGVSASLVTITGTSGAITQSVLSPLSGNLSPRSPEETATLLVAMTMKPRVKGAPVDKDTGRKVARGSTHPAEVTLQRLEGYAGEITLRQSARQSYQVQGITGRDIVVPAGATTAWFPCFMPEWLETIRTSRMGIVSELKLADPKGKIRHLVAPIDGFVTMTMEGALLKLSNQESELTPRPGEPIVVKVRLARSPRLTESVRLELKLPEELAGIMKMEPVVVAPGQTEADVRITLTGKPAGEHSFTIRGTAIQAGNLPVVSETTFRTVFPSAAKQ
jgi:hypothetical protein